MALPVYPFSAVVGQQRFKLALLLAAINPAIGGVLISGPRGSAKSTLARAVGDLLPSDEAHFVTLPLGASIERLTGSLKLDTALQEHRVEFQAGLLAKAHQGILYVDEVNLLHDSLVDVLLDVAASGRNIIERDSISHEHASKFLLIGTMNPDEGELRPQLLDRFGLAVEIDSQYTLDQRVEIVQRREQFDTNPEQFIRDYAVQQRELAQILVSARAIVAQVTCPAEVMHEIASRCIAAHVDGLRADIVWQRAAKAYAAMKGLSVVNHDCVDAVASLVLNHRQQSPNQPPPSSPPPSPFKRPEPSAGSHTSSSGNDSPTGADGDWGSMNAAAPSVLSDIREATIAPAFFTAIQQAYDVAASACGNTVADGKAAVASIQSNGRALGVNHHDSQPSLTGGQVNWPASLSRRALERDADVQFHALQRTEQRLHIIVLDTSASGMADTEGLLAAAKHVVIGLAEAAYLAREQWMLWGFEGESATVLMSRRRSPKDIAPILAGVSVGGGTPLRQALLDVSRDIRQLSRQNPQLTPLCTVITDGCTRQSLADINLNCTTVLVDTEAHAVKRGRGPELAQQLAAHYISLQHYV